MSGRDTVRRSQMITPARELRVIQKATAFDCDSLVLDLEDAVAPSMKGAARENVRRALRTLAFPGKELAVRLNGLDTPWFLDDLLALEGLPVQSVVVPKISRPEEVAVLDTLLAQLELRGGPAGVTLQLLIESARGLEAASEIAAASPRIVSLIFGAADYTADTGIAFTRTGLWYPRARLATAAAAAGVQALDHVHVALDDDAGLRAEALEARELGFHGKWAIHPRQIAVINEAFVPSPQELREAKRLIRTYEAAKSSGQGAIAVDGMMVDEATVKIMARRAAIAQRLGIWDDVEA